MLFDWSAICEKPHIVVLRMKYITQEMINCVVVLYISAGNSLQNVLGELSLFWLLDETEYSSPVLLKSTAEMRGNH